jgi:hypothetical protein
MLDKKVQEIAKQTGFGKWLDEYTKTGLETYKIMCEWELKQIRSNYGFTTYKQLNDVYESVRDGFIQR